MRYMHLKNYRSIENSEFLFSNINLLVGDNNTGKTSILKFIETIYKNETLDFKKTYIADYSINELKLNKTKPIQVFIASWDLHNRNEKTSKKELMFEYIEIDKIENLEDDGDPLITKIVTFDIQKNICIFNLKYTKIENSKRKFLTEIETYITKNIFNNITSFKENMNLCDKLNNYINNQTNIIKKYETIIFPSEYINSLPDKILNSNKEFNEYKKQNLDKKVSQEFEKIRIKNNKLILEYNLLSRNASKLDISLLYWYFIVYISMDKNEINNIQNYRRWYYNSRFFDYPYEIKYVNPIRKLFQKFYTGTEEILKENLEIFERNTNLTKKINNFFKKSKMLDEIIIKNKEIDGTKIIFPKYIKNKNQMNLYISGTGVSQVLPILTDTFNEKIDKIFIEQPEVHLHPRAQSLLGEIFSEHFNFSLQKNSKESRCLKQAFIETHSMFLINNFRYNIFANSKKIKNYESPIIWFFDNLNEKTKIYNIFINESGKYIGKSNKINDFFIEESLKILKMK